MLLIFWISIPGHCGIHLAAGPQLLEECKKLGGIPTTVAKITSGCTLPCKYIIHVTGPQAKNDICDFDALSKSYINCLNLAQENNIKEIAFYCISTGIFGFPKKESAQVAYKTIKEWLLNKHSFKQIIFDVFTYEDEMIYQSLIE